ncbi:hypothetical protein HJG60_009447 [Phyllostomus discolor]|uniref:Uncharacterized protein n=1 Tax=Phyllostomus discolor TaxID=89673 RepID=A0A834DCI2_9CHIR|nr:hypothetical protein HJG60_009447 [Phyllostomus discolor]
MLSLGRCRRARAWRGRGGAGAGRLLLSVQWGVKSRRNAWAAERRSLPARAPRLGMETHSGRCSVETALADAPGSWGGDEVRGSAPGGHVAFALRRLLLQLLLLGEAEGAETVQMMGPGAPAGPPAAPAARS